MVTAVNAYCLRHNLRDPGATAAGMNVWVTAACLDWPNASPGKWFPGGLTKARAASWVNGMAALGVDATSIASFRAFFGV